MSFAVRRVVTSVTGSPIASDGPPPNSVFAPNGAGVAELWWLDGPPTDVSSGGDRTSPGYPLEPPPGGMSSRIIQLPATGEWLRVHGDDDASPGMHATDTLDLVVILEGSIVLATPEGETVLHAGDTVIQGGAQHRWKVDGPGPCTYWVTMLRPSDGVVPIDLSAGTGDSPVRRVITGSAGLRETHAPIAIAGGSTTIVDVWQTGGPVTGVEQGGDAPLPWALDPLGGGVAMRWLQMQPHDETAGMWHATPTIDIDVILAGRIAVELEGDQRVELGAGDVVIQRGTNHRWLPIGDEPVRFVAVMLGLPA